MITERQEFYFEVAEFKKSTIYENGGFWSKLDLWATFKIKKKNSHPDFDYDTLMSSLMEPDCITRKLYL